MEDSEEEDVQVGLFILLFLCPALHNNIIHSKQESSPVYGSDKQQNSYSNELSQSP